MQADDLTPDIDTADALSGDGGTPWRTEVKQRGRFWQWRKGRAQERISRYGGRFELLTAERQQEYRANVQKRKRRAKAARLKAQSATRTSPG